MDAFVLSSNSEGTSMSVLEAMASGVPVVATAVGGTPALVEGGRSGVLVPPGDEAALAGAIGTLLDDGDRRRALSVRGRERVVRDYSEQTMCERYLALYRGEAMAVGTTPAIVEPAICAE
jgi:glycosyltransferase involved in cell wall biosynthesis